MVEQVASAADDVAAQGAAARGIEGILGAALGDSTFAELIAPLVFIACWGGYSLFADQLRAGSRSLMHRMNEYRRAWFVQLLLRDNRIADVQVVQVLVQNVSFFASSAILIVGGFLAVLGAAERAREIAAEIPFAEQSSPLVWDLKVMLLIVIFVYAFFKFTWSLRQFNYLAVLVGAAPFGHTAETLTFAGQMATVATRASDHFNRAMRAYYFGLAALTWFIQSWLFMLVSMLVVVVVYRREYRSNVYAVLGPVGQPIPGTPPRERP